MRNKNSGKKMVRMSRSLLTRSDCSVIALALARLNRSTHEEPTTILDTLFKDGYLTSLECDWVLNILFDLQGILPTKIPHRNLYQTRSKICGNRR